MQGPAQYSSVAGMLLWAQRWECAHVCTLLAVQDVRSLSGTSAPIMLVANKVDLGLEAAVPAEAARVSAEEEGEALLTLVLVLRAQSQLPRAATGWRAGCWQSRVREQLFVESRVHCARNPMRVPAAARNALPAAGLHRVWLGLCSVCTHCSSTGTARQDTQNCNSKPCRHLLPTMGPCSWRHRQPMAPMWTWPLRSSSAR